MIPHSSKAFRLMMDGAQALSDVEQNGMRIDVSYLDRAIHETDKRIKILQSEIKDDKVYTIWKRRFGANTNLGSRDQLGQIIFGELQIEATHKTATGKPKTDIEALEEIDVPFVKKWNNIEKLKKVRGTYLLGIKRELAGEFLHPFFHLHLATTYRSSSSEINFQNLPNRDRKLAKLVRQAFIPRSKDHVIVEVDYSALEFRGAANFWKDPRMISYASDSSLDIHRDMAAACFCLKTESVSKEARTCAKNQFVFPLLYGSYFKNIATGIWTYVGKSGTKNKEGIHLYDHLRGVGISDIHEYRDHVKNVELQFRERFSRWDSDQEKWWQNYLRKGWFPLATGFICSGVFSRNFAMNAPIQGSSFHCLLWSLIQLNNWIKKHSLKTRIIGQIHDSIVADVYKSELQDYLNIAKRIMTIDIREMWKWIATPLDIEAEVAENRWFEKKEWIEKGGVWEPK